MLDILECWSVCPLPSHSLFAAPSYCNCSSEGSALLLLVFLLAANWQHFSAVHFYKNYTKSSHMCLTPLSGLLIDSAAVAATAVTAVTAVTAGGGGHWW